MMFGELLRLAREKAGLSRGELRLRILRFYPTSPSINAIRDLEQGRKVSPQPRNRLKYLRIFPDLPPK